MILNLRVGTVLILITVSQIKLYYVKQIKVALIISLTHQPCFFWCLRRMIVYEFMNGLPIAGRILKRRRCNEYFLCRNPYQTCKCYNSINKFCNSDGCLIR